MNTPLCPPEIDSVEDLRQLQRRMAAVLMAPLTPRADRLPEKNAAGESMRQVAESFIKPNDRLSSVDRLEIYARQYWFRLLDSLYDDFPAVRTLLGDAKFHKLSKAYLAECPSESWTLRNLGSRLEGFLLGNPALTVPWTEAAVGIARLEWAQTVAFDEIHYPVPNPESLLGGDPSVLTLGLQPSVTLLREEYAVDEFFFAMRRKEADSRSDSSSAVAAPAAADPRRRPSRRKPRRDDCCLAVHRYRNSIFIKRLEPEAHRLLTSLRDGATVAAAVDAALAEADPATDWIPKIRGWFENWAHLGWFCDRSLLSVSS